jgi:hypothetical protein
VGVGLSLGRDRVAQVYRPDTNPLKDAPR